MSILNNITNTIATAVLVAGMSVHSMDARADVKNDVNGADTTTELVQETNDTIQTQGVPETALQFRQGKIGGQMVEITPSVVQQYAQRDQFKMPVAREENVVSLKGFFDFREDRNRQNKAGIFIGVVVGDDPYTPLSTDYDGRDQFREVHKRVAELVTGHQFTDVGIVPGLGDKVDMDVGMPGYAELYGAEVQGIIPLRYQENAEITYPGDIKVPIREGDIFIMINDSPFALQNPTTQEDIDNHKYVLPSNVDEMETLLKHYLVRDIHLYTYEEYNKHEEEILLAARNKNREFYSAVSPSDSTGGTGGGKDPEITAIAFSHQ